MNTVIGLLAAAAVVAAPGHQIIKAPPLAASAFDSGFQKTWPELFTPDMRLRMSVLPSFSPRYAVGVGQSGNRYRIVYRAQPWQGAAWFDLPVAAERCDSALDSALGARVVAAWRHMVVEVLPQEPQRMGLDGETFLFAFQDGERTLRADSWSPQEGTPPALLVNMSNGLAAYCTSARHWFLAPVTWYNGLVLERRLNALDTALAKPGALR